MRDSVMSFGEMKKTNSMNVFDDQYDMQEPSFVMMNGNISNSNYPK